MWQDQLRAYWPVAVIAGFFLWRFLKFRRVKSKLPALLREGALLVDVRSPQEFAAGHHPESLNVPLGDIDAKCRQWDKAKPVVLCCASGTRSGMAVGILKKNGFQTVLNAGPWMNTL